MTALARHLQARNHEVVFLYSETAAGLPFVPPPGNDHLKESMPEMSKLKGEDAKSFAMRALMTEIEFIIENDASNDRSETGVDALLIDLARFDAELGAMQLGMPYIHVSNALHLDYTGYTPLCLYGWPHLTTPAYTSHAKSGRTNPGIEIS